MSMTAYGIQPPRTGAVRPRGSKVLMILGVVVLVLGVIAIPVGFAMIGDSASEISGRAERIRQELLVEVDVPGTGEAQLEPGRYFAYAIDPVQVRDHESTATSLGDEPGVTVLNDQTNTTEPLVAEPTVTVTGPDGTPVPLELPAESDLIDSLAGDLLVIDKFRITEAGTYTVAASGTGADRVGVGRATDYGAAVGRAVGGGLLSLLGFGLATLGGILALAGLIWFLVSGASSGPPPPTNWGPPPGPWGPQPPVPPGSWGPSAGPTAPPGGAWAPPGQPGPWGWAPPPAAVPTADEPPADHSAPAG